DGAFGLGAGRAVPPPILNIVFECVHYGHLCHYPREASASVAPGTTHFSVLPAFSKSRTGGVLSSQLREEFTSWHRITLTRLLLRNLNTRKAEPRIVRSLAMRLAYSKAVAVKRRPHLLKFC